MPPTTETTAKPTLSSGTRRGSTVSRSAAAAGGATPGAAARHGRRSFHRPRSAPLRSGPGVHPARLPDGVKTPSVFSLSLSLNCSVRCGEEIVKAGDDDKEGLLRLPFGDSGGRGQVALRAADR